MTEALKNMMNVCFKEKKYLCRQVNAGVHRTYSMSCTSVNRPNKRVEVENILHLLFYIWKRRRQRRKSWWEGFLFMIVSILPVSLFRRNNQGII